MAGRPPKPYAVIKGEKKSHRTKAEMKLREEGEKALLSGYKLKEASEIKDDEFAHKQFRHVSKLMKSIEKNDDLYSAVINRYCRLLSEENALVLERDRVAKDIELLRKSFEDGKKEVKPGTNTLEYISDFTKALGTLLGQYNKMDSAIMTKRKMLFDIEKENIMTVSSALRNVPKKEEKATNPLLEALKNG